MCLSVFLVLESPKRPGAVLLGKIDPAGPWWEIGALDPGRIRGVGERWMLPSRQLFFFESPIEGAHRILQEQLESGPIPLDGPQVFSDPSARPDKPNSDPHWDFHFVFRGRWPTDTAPKAKAWKHLEFVEIAKTPRGEIARSQGDVLELVGVPPRD